MISKIESIVCAGENISPALLHSKSKLGPIKTARQIICWIAKQETRMSLVAIGAYYGQGHCNVINSIKIVNNLIDTEPLFESKVKGYHNKIIRYKVTFNRIDECTLLLANLNNKIQSLFSELTEANLQITSLKNEIQSINNYK